MMLPRLFAVDYADAATFDAMPLFADAIT